MAGVGGRGAYYPVWKGGNAASRISPIHLRYTVLRFYVIFMLNCNFWQELCLKCYLTYLLPMIYPGTADDSSPRLDIVGVMEFTQQPASLIYK